MKTVRPILVGISLALAAASASAQVDSNREIRVQIESQILRDALNAWAQQTGYQLISQKSEVTNGIVVPAIAGTMSPRAALERLLAGTSLTYELQDERTVVIRDRAKTPLPVKRLAYASDSAEGDGRSAQAKSRNKGPTGGETGSQNAELEVIVVTAQKREERLQDVPASISAITGDRLDALQIGSLVEMTGYVPGLSVTNAGAPGANTLQIRGLNTGGDFAGPMVGTYIDDVPVGSSTAGARGNLFNLDLMPYDLERVEVLKGPQGTLYGGNAMGGLIKYVLRKPNLKEFEGQAGMDGQYISGSANPGWGIRASINAPIVTDKLAVRLSGFHNETAGFIDNIGTHKNDSNQIRQAGGHGTALWQVTDNLSLQASVLAQDTDVEDLGYVTMDGTKLGYHPLYGEQKTSTHFPQSFVQKTRNYALTVNWNFGFANLTSTAGWSKLHANMWLDYTDGYGAFAGVPNALINLNIDTVVNKFVEETRLSSSGDGRLQWMLGGYHTSELGSEHDTWPVFTSTYQPTGLDLLRGHANNTYKENAVFANLTYKLSDRFDIGVGERYSSYKQSNDTVTGGPFGGAPPLVASQPSKGISTWLADARFHLDEDSMMYARVAKGYRGGRINGPRPVSLGAPAASDPDTTINYELGLKGLFFNQLQLEFSVYHIDWSDMQLQVNVPGVPPDTAIENVNKAVSNGAELSVLYQVTSGLRLGAAVAYVDAHLEGDNPADPFGGVYGRKGDQLPFSINWTASATLDYTHTINPDMTATFGGGYRYRDRTNLVFRGGTPHTVADPSVGLAPWNIFDLYVGLAIKQLSLRLSGQNVFADNSYAGTQYIVLPSAPRYVPVQPRTVMLSVDYKF